MDENQKPQSEQLNEANNTDNNVADLKDVFAASKDYRRKPIKTKVGAVSRIFGIIAICFIWLSFGCGAILPMTLGFVALVLGIIGKILDNRDDKANVGMGLGIISIVIPVIIFFIFIIFPAMARGHW